jgi:hypothetical protein
VGGGKEGVCGCCRRRGEGRDVKKKGGEGGIKERR